jgi:hypothetical protein
MVWHDPHEAKPSHLPSICAEVSAALADQAERHGADTRKLEAERDRLYEELSESLGCDATEPDGTVLPVLRCSPRLAEWLATARRELAEARERIAELERERALPLDQCCLGLNPACAVGCLVEKSARTYLREARTAGWRAAKQAALATARGCTTLEAIDRALCALPDAPPKE